MDSESEVTVVGAELFDELVAWLDEPTADPAPALVDAMRRLDQTVARDGSDETS